MKLLTIIPAILLFLVLSSCEKTLPETVINDEIKSIDRTFYFAPEIRPGEESNGYSITASLEEVNIDGFFSIKWGNAEEHYAFSFIPADNEVRFLKFFDGKDCLEIAEMDFNLRNNSFDFEVIEDEKGKVIVSLGGVQLFENSAKSFTPESGTYSADGGLKVSKFRLL